MTDPWTLAAGLLAGTAFGWVYFAMLWHGTVRFTQSAGHGGHGASWLLAGFALRMAMVIGALALAVLSGAGAAEMLAAVFGFTLARQVAIRRRPRTG